MDRIELKVFKKSLICSSQTLRAAAFEKVPIPLTKTMNSVSSTLSSPFPLPLPSSPATRSHHHFSLVSDRTPFHNLSVSVSVSGRREATVRAVSEDADTTKGSGTTARGRRLLKVREEKRKREHDQKHNYPSWAKVLENASRHDEEMRAVLGDSIGNPELMRKRVVERVQRKGRNFQKSKTGSVLAFKVSFRDFDPTNSFIWFELYGAPSDRDVDLLGSVFQSWYVMGRLGAFNSSNLQLVNVSMDHNPIYDDNEGAKVMPSSFHDISDVEFQDNWGRVWVDLGTSDYFAMDVLLNCLTVASSEYVGIQQVVFGGKRMGDWEEGMTNPEYGYKYFKI